MPEILPFRGVRYAASRSPALSRLISPPYDVVSPAYRDDLAARSPHNIVHVMLARERPDVATEHRYDEAGKLFAAWLADGTLRQDAQPALFPLEQAFIGPDGRPRVRRSVIAAARLHSYGEGRVLPHEKTLGGALADRLAVLRRVEANLSPVFGLYEDAHGEGVRALASAIAAAGEPVAEARSDDGTSHRLWRSSDEGFVAAVRRAVAERQIFIADGHHRYEAALVYRDLVDRERPGLPAHAGHRYIMMALCSMADPGLVIYPTHRLVRGIAGLSVVRLVEELARFFKVETLAEDLRRPAGRAWAVSKLAEHAGKSTTFLMVSADDGKGRVLTLRDEADFSGVALPDNRTVRDLDVTALHGVVLRHVLARHGAADGDLRYESDAGEAVARTLSGEYQLAFLVNPTPMWQVQAVAESGETMPEKSTFFYPKLASGLVMRRLNEEL